jgi:hypothetical protein
MNLQIFVSPHLPQWDLRQGHGISNYRDYLIMDSYEVLTP